jgi:DNA repair protein RadC
MAITDWPADERPRERLIAGGAASLSDAELLAIFLRVGVTGLSAVDLAREMLKQFGSLSALVAAPLTEFVKIKGLGDAKYAQLQATVELARRALGEQLKAAPVFRTANALQDFVRLKIGSQPQEVFFVMLLGADLSLLHSVELFRGSVAQTAVYPREIVKLALTHNASAVVIAHNHPMGDLTPSSEDIRATSAIKHALATLSIELTDHLIVSPQGAVSLQALGLMG